MCDADGVYLLKELMNDGIYLSVLESFGIANRLLHRHEIIGLRTLIETPTQSYLVLSKTVVSIPIACKQNQRGGAMHLLVRQT